MAVPSKTPRLSHLDAQGGVRMVDVGAKTPTVRHARAQCHVALSPSVLRRLRQLPKGDPLEVARIAGISAAKRTAELIPLCHSLPLSHADVRIRRVAGGLQIQAEASTCAQTGVEMEALTAAAVAALTIYDMCKAVDKSIVIGDLMLLEKSGGRSGTWQRAQAPGKSPKRPSRTRSPRHTPGARA